VAKFAAGFSSRPQFFTNSIHLADIFLAHFGGLKPCLSAVKSDKSDSTVSPKNLHTLGRPLRSKRPCHPALSFGGWKIFDPAIF